MKDTWWNEVKLYAAKRVTSKIITLKFPKKHRDLLNTFKEETDKVIVRIALIELKDEEKEIV